MRTISKKAGKGGEGNKEKRDQDKTKGVTTGVNGNIATIALNVRGRNTKIKRRRLPADFFKKSETQLYVSYNKL